MSHKWRLVFNIQANFAVVNKQQVKMRPFGGAYRSLLIKFAITTKNDIHVLT